MDGLWDGVWLDEAAAEEAGGVDQEEVGWEIVEPGLESVKGGLEWARSQDECEGDDWTDGRRAEEFRTTYGARAEAFAHEVGDGSVVWGTVLGATDLEQGGVGADDGGGLRGGGTGEETPEPVRVGGVREDPDVML
ncbi:MAG: hypothetical protein U0821_27180 [Chloroflexota bacterium]